MQSVELSLGSAFGDRQKIFLSLFLTFALPSIATTRSLNLVSPHCSKSILYIKPKNTSTIDISISIFKAVHLCVHKVYTSSASTYGTKVCTFLLRPAQNHTSFLSNNIFLMQINSTFEGRLARINSSIYRVSTRSEVNLG